MKTLLIDLETSPNIGHVWSLWNQNLGLNQIVEWGEVIAFSAKWLGNKKVYFHSVFHDGKQDMIQRAWDLLDEADVVVTYNGVNFDMRWLRMEFLLAGMSPPSPWKDVDLLKAVKKQFRFASNKLQSVSTQLGLEGKVAHTGHELWVKCMAGDPKAWALMKRYAIQDTKLMEPLYERLLPWIPGHPNINLYNGTDGCPKCGSTHFQKRGTRKTQTREYQQYQCQDCRAWFTDGSSISGANYRGVA